MINELMKVADAMKAWSKALEWHSDMHPLPKASASAPCIRVWLTSDGRIDGVEKLTIEHAAQLRKFAPNKFRSLPGFNITVLRGMEECAEKERKLEKSVQGLTRNFTAAREEIEKLCGNKLDRGETLAKLLAAVKKIDARQFQATFDEKIQSNGGGWQAKPDNKVSVFLDVKDYQDYPVAHATTIERLNSLLLDADLETPVHENAKDAYNGDADGSDALFSDINLPRRLGQIKIRSLNKDIPAQFRYHRVGSETFPVGKVSRKRTETALKWISALENEGATFGVAGDNELLFAYAAVLPSDSLPQLATLLGVERTDLLSEQKFQDLSKSVIAHLKGAGEASKDGELEIFTLRKMDKARTKVVYCRNTTVGSLEAASRSWAEGFKNIPPLDIRTWGYGKSDRGKRFTVPVEPQTLFPVKLHKILNTVWTLSRDKVKQSKVKLFEPSTGLRLLLDESKVKLFEPSTGLRLLLDPPEQAQAAFIMERFVAHAQTYFAALCRAKGRDEVALVKPKGKPLPDVDTYPGVLGLLLYKLGKTKENYMNESAFQLGRFLRVTDEIHRLYCEVMRKGDIPAELCGSSALAATLENPTQALAQLCQRSAPYLKWARAYHGEEKGGLVHYWMRQWSPIADTLHQANWPARPSPMDRAQIFLGYLSSFPKSENTSTETTESEGTQQ